MGRDDAIHENASIRVFSVSASASRIIDNRVGVPVRQCVEYSGVEYSGVEYYV